MTSLPFLYCTRTILSLCGKQASLAPHSSHPVKRLHVSLKYRQHAFKRHRDDNVPFEGTGASDRRPIAPRSSTLTPAEKSVFDRIARERESAEEETSLGTTDIDVNDPYDDLNKLFDAAIRDQELREQRQQESFERNRIKYADVAYEKAVDEVVRRFDPRERLSGIEETAKQGLVHHMSLEEGKKAGPSADSSSTDEIRRVCVEHRMEVKAKLEAAVTDGDIWATLEADLFSLVKQYNGRIKEEEQGEEEEQRSDKKRSRGRKSKAQSKNKAPSSVTAEQASMVTDSPAEHAVPGVLGISKSLTKHHLLSLLQDNYAYLNLLALRLWRRRHPTTPYSLRLLPEIKAMGTVSYVLGASTGLYNEVLYGKWTQHRDLHGIADLLHEMMRQGLEPNQLTNELLRSIERTRVKDVAGKRGKVLKSWWRLRGVNEAWARVRQVYKQVEQVVERSQLDTREIEKPDWANEEEGIQALLNAQDDGSVAEEGTRKFKVHRVQVDQTKDVPRKYSRSRDSQGERSDSRGKRPLRKVRAG